MLGMKTENSLLLLFLICLGCSPKQQDVVVKVKKVYGLSNTTTVTLHGNTIGKVRVAANQPYAEIIFSNTQKETLKLAKDSELEMAETATLKKMELHIIQGKSNKWIHNGDTLNWVITDSEKELEKKILIGDSIFVDTKKVAFKNHNNQKP